MKLGALVGPMSIIVVCYIVVFLAVFTVLYFTIRWIVGT